MSKRMPAVPQNLLRAATITVGFIAIVVGVSEIYGPAGWIIAGLLLLAAVGLPIW